MFGWFRKKRGPLVLPLSEVEVEVEAPPPPPPRPRYRITQGPHDGWFRVEEDLSHSYRGILRQNWMVISLKPLPNEREAEDWLERHIAGPKIIKEYR